MLMRKRENGLWQVIIWAFGIFVRLFYSVHFASIIQGGETFSTSLVILAAFRLYIDMNSNGNKSFSYY